MFFPSKTVETTDDIVSFKQFKEEIKDNREEVISDFKSFYLYLLYSFNKVMLFDFFSCQNRMEFSNLIYSFIGKQKLCLRLPTRSTLG
jgi:transcriptional antiterminator